MEDERKTFIAGSDDEALWSISNELSEIKQILDDLLTELRR